MALNKENLIQLARAAGKAAANPSAKFSFNGEDLSAEALNKTFVQELNTLGGTAADFRENQNLIFRLIEENLTEVLPQKVMQTYGQFADVKTYAQGDTPVFKLKITEASRKRAKSFVTKVGLAGRYETFKLDGTSMEVKTSAYGGAARVEWEELLNGSFSMNDYYNLVLEGLDEIVYKEIAKALESMITTIGQKNPNNIVSTNQFNEKAFDKLLQIADAYGKGTIYCTFEFAARMLPADSGKWSDSMKEQIWNNGYFATYKNHNVVVLPQSFTDATNSQKVIDPSKCYIIPTGAEKPIKVAFEGSAQVKSFENRDWSQEIQTYQKFGVAAFVINPGICVYEDKDLTKDF